MDLFEFFLCFEMNVIWFIFEFVGYKHYICWYTFFQLIIVIVGTIFHAKNRCGGRQGNGMRLNER